jgi:hypothetical protein
LFHLSANLVSPLFLEQGIFLNPTQRSRGLLAKLLGEEQIKLYQRAKVNDVLFGDNNTKYFQMIANDKHRKKRIFSLDSDNGIIEGHENLKSYITQFYKGIFGESEQSSFTLDANRSDFDISQVTGEENAILTAPFSENEIKVAIFQMEHNKAPGPDGFPREFYQKFWDTIKSDLMSMFQELHSRELPVISLNFGVISLITKAHEVNHIQQYRPICLLNVSYKIFTKVATNRINQVTEHILSPSQTAFMRGRNILEGVVILHESIHELHKKIKWSYPKNRF